MKTDVVEHPILFTGEMVRAILDGRKTQTRRVMKRQGLIPDNWYQWGKEAQDATIRHRCPYGQPGEHLWVRETTKRRTAIGGAPFADYSADKETVKDGIGDSALWRYSKPVCPSIRMPRWASRIDLLVKDVRVERVQDISGVGSVAEGCGKQFADFELMHHGGYRTARHEFSTLWDSINKKHGFGWEKNPWVWVVEFERIGGEN